MRLSEEPSLVARIDAFIESHPERPATLNALRIRKAMLLLQTGRPNFARAPFEAFDPRGEGNTRDRALYDARSTLLFWWSVAGIQDPSQFPTDAKFFGRQQELEGVIDGLPRSSVRAYLAALHAQLVMKRVENLSGSRALSELESAFARYLAEFDDADRQATRALFDPATDAAVFRAIPETRVRFLGQVPGLLKRFIRTWEHAREDDRQEPFSAMAPWIP